MILSLPSFYQVPKSPARLVTTSESLWPSSAQTQIPSLSLWGWNTWRSGLWPGGRCSARKGSWAPWRMPGCRPCSPSRSVQYVSQMRVVVCFELHLHWTPLSFRALAESHECWWYGTESRWSLYASWPCVYFVFANPVLSETRERERWPGGWGVDYSGTFESLDHCHSQKSPLIL